MTLGALRNPNAVEFNTVPRGVRLVESVWPRGGVRLCPSLGEGGEMLWGLETSWGNQSNEEIAVGKPNRKVGSAGLLRQDHFRKSIDVFVHNNDTKTSILEG